MKNTYFILAISIISNCFGSSCNSFSNETSCKNSKNCQWKQSDKQACSLYDCVGQESTTCAYYQMYGECIYSIPKSGYCQVKSSACTVQSAADSTCNSSINCDFVPASPATCANVGSNFGCSQIQSSSECGQNPQCGWMATYCKPNTEVCSNQSYTDCDTTGCQVRVDSCSLKKNASQTCAALTTESDCISKGCIFQNNVCSAPTKCFASNNSCTDICEIASGSCTYRSSVCQVYSDNECNKNFCKWVTDAPVCANTGGYCNLETCSQKAPYCKNQDAQSPYCTPKTATNQCLYLSEDECTNSSNSSFCEFVMPQDENCSNPISDCSPFANKNFCNGQKPCHWGNITSCVELPVPSVSFSPIVRALIVFTLSMFLF